jgi:hypothetical protein
MGSRAVIPTADDVTIADDEEQFLLVIVVQRCQGIDCPPQRILALRVARDLAKDELVLHPRRPLGG